MMDDKNNMQIMVMIVEQDYNNSIDEGLELNQQHTSQKDLNMVPKRSQKSPKKTLKLSQKVQNSTKMSQNNSKKSQNDPEKVP